MGGVGQHGRRVPAGQAGEAAKQARFVLTIAKPAVEHFFGPSGLMRVHPDLDPEVADFVLREAKAGKELVLGGKGRFRLTVFGDDALVGRSDGGVGTRLAGRAFGREHFAAPSGNLGPIAPLAQLNPGVLVVPFGRPGIV